MSNAQYRSAGIDRGAYPQHLYDLDERVRNGDKDAFLELARYAGSKVPATDYMGYHVIFTTQGSVATRLLEENSFFMVSEIDLADTTVGVKIAGYLADYAEELQFDPIVGAFLVTPLKKRTVQYELKEVPEFQMAKLRMIEDSVLHGYWTRGSEFAALAKAHDPHAMLVAAQTMLRNRGRYNEYDFDKHKYTDAIALLTGVYVGVPDVVDVMHFELDNTYETDVLLHYAVYWYTHYSDYKWNQQKGLFENVAQKPAELSDAYKWYLQMQDTADEVAIAAFIHLTEVDPEVIPPLNEEFGEERNYCVPLFHKKFLVQLTQLTKYCRAQHINYRGTPKLQQDILSLRNRKLSLKRRRATEDRLIMELQPDDVTAVEYWSLVYESYWPMASSAGRILDIYYSRNWQKIVTNKKFLQPYLKKSALFHKLGIIGSCNDYLCKFADAGEQTKQQLASIEQETQDDDVRQSADRVLNGTYWLEKAGERKRDSIWTADVRKKEPLEWPYDGSAAAVTTHFEDTLEKIVASHLALDEKKERIRAVAPMATYAQIPVALKYLSEARYEDMSYYCEEELLKQQFGITVDDFAKTGDIDAFLKNYHTLSELQLYRYYLKKAGINIWNTNGSLNYDSVYRLLKHDLVVPFVGGNNSDAGIFAVAKILALQFGTRLGLPDRSQFHESGTHYVFSDDHRKKWIHYLVAHNLLTRPDREPPSFSDWTR